MKRLFLLILIAAMVVGSSGCAISELPSGEDSSQQNYADPQTLVGQWIDGEPDSQEALFRKVYDSLWPYLMICSYDYLNYPDLLLESQDKILTCIGYGITRSHISVTFDIQDFYNQGNYLYIIPREVFDKVLYSYFDDLVLDDNYLIEQGVLLADKSAYSLNLEGFGLVGTFLITEARWTDNMQLELKLEVWYSLEDKPRGFVNILLEDSGEHFKFEKVEFVDNPENPLKRKI